MIARLTALAAAAGSFALAAAGHGHISHPEGGFASGFWHPILGFDHLLAMVAVGLLSVQMGGRAIWLVPAAFVVVMAGGGALGVAGVPLPAVELAIAVSALAVGAAIAAERRWPAGIAMGFVGFFALFHGHAHGAEIPQLAGPAVYVAGFMLATALLHLAGVALGAACAVAREPSRLRALLGAGVAGAGAHLSLLALTGG